MQKISAFSYVNAINSVNQTYFKDNKGEEYKPFLVNRMFSYWPDTIFQANEMNLFKDIPNENQYDYYVNTLRPRKRFAKWIKVADNDTVQAVCDVFEVNYTRALEILPLLNEEQKKQIKALYTNNDK